MINTGCTKNRILITQWCLTDKSFCHCSSISIINAPCLPIHRCDMKSIPNQLKLKTLEYIIQWLVKGSEDEEISMTVNLIWSHSIWQIIIARCDLSTHSVFMYPSMSTLYRWVKTKNAKCGVLLHIHQAGVKVTLMCWTVLGFWSCRQRWRVAGK